MTTSTSVSIRTVPASQRQAALSTLMLAFSTDPVGRWLYPDPDAFVTNFSAVTLMFGGRAFENDSAYGAEDGSGVALWLPPGVQPEGDAMAEHLARTLPEARHESVFAVLGEMGEYHPHEPHWYLPVMGVDPARQGQGVGSALLTHALAVCDSQHLPAYLESSNPRNIPLYERHGFQAIAKIQSGASPLITPMLRKAR